MGKNGPDERCLALVAPMVPCTVDGDGQVDEAMFDGPGPLVKGMLYCVHEVLLQEVDLSLVQDVRRAKGPVRLVAGARPITVHPPLSAVRRDLVLLLLQAVGLVREETPRLREHVLIIVVLPAQHRDLRLAGR